MQMVNSYSNFMIYELKNNGERARLNIIEEEFIQNDGKAILHSSQVLIIIKEEIRRIYIWKGFESSVRKKFIASRVAGELQNELTHTAHFHRCKIISVDQGDEPNEFLKNFNFKKIKIEKKKEDSHKDQKNVIKSSISNFNYPSFQKKNQNKKEIIYNNKQTVNGIEQTIPNEKELLDEILKNKSLQSYKRKHILIGRAKLYGIIEKKSDIFGKQVEKKNWEQIIKFPKDIIELEEYKLRIHLNPKNNIVKAIEIFENLSEKKENIQIDKKSVVRYNFEKWTVNYLRQYCKENKIKIPSGCKKAEVVRYINEYLNSL